MAPTPSSGGSKTIERLRRAGRRRGVSGRGSSPRASSCSRSPATPNWAPTAERGSVASCPMAVSPNSAKRWRVAGSAGSRSSGSSASSRRASARKAAGASGRSGCASRAASTASQRFSPAPTRTGSGLTSRHSATARAAMRRSSPSIGPRPVMSTSATPTATGSTRGERSSRRSSIGSQGAVSASGRRRSGQTRASSRSHGHPIRPRSCGTGNLACRLRRPVCDRPAHRPAAMRAGAASGAQRSSGSTRRPSAK